MSLPPANALVRRARTRFGTLLPAELRLLDGLVAGAVVDLEDPPDSGSERAAHPYHWATWADHFGRTVRADFLRWLCVTSALHGRIDPKGIQLRGALVPDRLDLASIQIPFGLRLIDSALPFGVVLSEAHGTTMEFGGSFLHTLKADSLHLGGGLALWPDVRCTAGVNLQDARIDGDLGIGGMFSNDRGPALDARRMRAGGAVAIATRTRFDGLVTFQYSEIRSYVDLRGVRFCSRDGIALELDHAGIGGALHLNDRARAVGGLSLMGTVIGSDLHLSKSNFRARPARNPVDPVPTEGGAIMGDQIRVGGSIMMRDTIAHGGVRFSRARVERDTDLNGARICSLRGPVHSLWSERSLQVDAAHLTGPVFLEDGFRADNLVDFSETTFEQSISVECTVDPSGCGSPRALRLSGARVHGSLRLARVGPADVEIQRPIALNLAQASVTSLADSEKFWELVAPGGVRLDGFEYAGIADDSPTSSKFRIGHFLGKQWKDASRPETFFPGPFRVLARVLRESGHDSDANRVLIAMERTRRRASGIRRLARHPRLKREIFWGWFRARIASVGWAVWDTILDVTIRFGYRSTLALVWMLGVWLACALVFSSAYDSRVMAPSAPGLAALRDPREAKSAEKWRGGYSVPTHYPTFHAALYSLDVLLPVVDLHQEADWLPIEPKRVREMIESGRGAELGLTGPVADRRAGSAPPSIHVAAVAEAAGLARDSATAPASPASGMGERIQRLERMSSVASVALPVEALLGWFLTTMFLAGLSGLIDRK